MTKGRWDALVWAENIRKDAERLEFPEANSQEKEGETI